MPMRGHNGVSLTLRFATLHQWPHESSVILEREARALGGASLIDWGRLCRLAPLNCASGAPLERVLAGLT